MWLFAGFSAWLTEEVADSTDAFTLFFSLLPHCCPPPPPPVPCLAIRFLSVHQCRGRGEKRGGGGLFWSMAGNQTMGREDVKQIGPITYLPTRIPQSHLSLHLFLAPFCVPICNTQKRTPTWPCGKTAKTLHIQTCIWPQTCCKKKKKHTAARSFRLICQHTYTHTHTTGWTAYIYLCLMGTLLIIYTIWIYFTSSRMQISNILLTFSRGP